MKFKFSAITLALISTTIPLQIQATEYTFNALISGEYTHIKEDVPPVEPPESDIGNPNPVVWLNFFQEHDQLLDTKSMYKVDTSDNVSIAGNLFNNEDLPNGTMGMLESGDMNFSGNSLTNVDFFYRLEKVQSDIDFTGSSIAQIDGLKSLKYVGSLTFDANSTFTSLKPIRSVKNGTISLNRELDEFDEYTDKLFMNDGLCLGITSGTVTFNDTGSLSPTSFCGSDDEWMTFFHSKGMFLGNQKQSDLNIWTEFKLNDMGLNNKNIPQSDFTITEPAILDLSGNDLDNLDFLHNVKKIKSAGSSSSKTSLLDLRGNKLSSIDGLSNLTFMYINNANSGLFFDPESTFTNILTLRKVNYGRIDLGRDVSEFDLYTNKLDYLEPLCQGIAKVNYQPNKANFVTIENNGVVQRGLDFCTTDDEWMNFLHDYDLLIPYYLQSQLTTKEIILSNKNLDENNIPKEEFTANSPAILDLSNNNFTNVDFLNNLTQVKSQTYYSSYTSTFDLRGNPLSNINGLNNFVKVELNGGNPKSGLFFGSEATFTDLSPLAQVHYGKIDLGRELNEFEQFTNKFDYGTDPICKAITKVGRTTGTNAKNEVNIFVNGVKKEGLDLCTTGDEWMDFLHRHNLFTSNVSQSQIGGNTAIFKLANKGLDENNIPQSDFTVDSLYQMDLSNNNFTNINFLESLSTLSVGKNWDEILDLRGNPISDISGLSGLRKVYFKNSLNVAVMFDNSATFTDLSPLVNLNEGRIRLSRDLNLFDQFTNKFESTDPICIGINAGKISFDYIGSYNSSDLCK